MDRVNVNGLGLRDQALLAAVRLTGGDLNQSFSAEQLLVEAWNCDKPAWGLRGFESEYPDPEKINKELNRRGSIGLVGQGVIQRVGSMVYRLTVAGLHEATQLNPTDAIARERAGRELEIAIKKILEHTVFKAWLADPARPKYFREAGHFWGIAPGTPAKTVRDRVQYVDRVVAAAEAILEEKGVGSISEQRGKLLFDRADLHRCAEFQQVLRKRFARDLELLDPGFGRVEAADSTS